MEKFSAIAQMSILLLIAFLIGILMTWWYLRRRYRTAQAYEGETKDLEIQRLNGELKRYSSVFEGKSPDLYRKKQENLLSEKDAEIKELKKEISKISVDGGSAEGYEEWESAQKELALTKQELGRLTDELEELSVNGEVLSPREFMAWTEAALEAKSAEISQLSREQRTSQAELPLAATLSNEMPVHDTQLAEQLGELRWELSEKEEALGSLKAQLDKKAGEVTRLSAELGQLKFVDMDGAEQSPLDAVAQLRGELTAKEIELAQWAEQAEGAASAEKNELAGQLGELRWELSEKEEALGSLKAQLDKKAGEVTRLSAELGQLKFVDMDGAEQSPLDAVAQLRGELTAKEAELAQWAEQAEGAASAEKNELAGQLGELRWELSEKEEALGSLKAQLDKKAGEVTRLSAELGQLKFVDMDGAEQSPLDAVAQLRGELTAKETELAQWAEQAEGAASAEKNELAGQLGELRWELSEKEEALGSLKAQLDKKAGEVTRLSAELGQLMFVDMDGAEQSPLDAVAQLRGELTAKEAELAQWAEQAEGAASAEKNELAGQLGELRWELSEKEEALGSLKAQLDKKAGEVTRLSAELGQLKFVDMDGAEQSPLDAVAQLRGELTAKETELAQWAEQAEGAASAEKNELAGQLGELRWELSEKEEALGSLKAQLDKKAGEVTRLSAELGQLKFVDMDGAEQSPLDAVAQLRGELLAKEEEINYLQLSQEESKVEEDHSKVEEIGKLRWQLSQQQGDLHAKQAEILRLEGALAQFHINGNVASPEAYFAQVSNQLAEKNNEIQSLSDELEKLKYVATQSQAIPPEEELEWREREAEIVRLSAENEQMRKDYTKRGIATDETYMDFIPEDIYKLLVEYGDEGISLSNHDGYFLVFNDRLQELTEYSKAEANDTTERIFLEKIYPDPSYRTEVANQISQIPEDGSFNSLRTQITTKGGTIRQLDVSSTTFYHKGMKYYLSAYVEVKETVS